MQKKNIVFIGRSLDGFIAGKNGELDWLEMIPNPDNVEMGFVSLMQEIDAVVMGKTTFEVVCSFDGEWPYMKHVFVLSNSKNICFRLGILLYSFFGLILELDRIENEFSDINVPLTTDVLDRLSLCVNSIGEDLYLLNLQR